jgi:hypothetical protein
MQLKFLRPYLVVVLIFLTPGCSEARFSGPAEQSQPDRLVDDQDISTGQNSHRDADISLPSPGASPPPLSAPSPVAETAVIYGEQEEHAKCWFAVSGSHFGFSIFNGENNHGSSFPLTLSGNPIESGEIFDRNSGGVFLNARPEPFEYHKGGGEIDSAVDTTFDSIAVSPGVSIELRNGSGELVYSGNGPYVAISKFPNPGLAARLMSLKEIMPPWMSQYLSERSFYPELLHGLNPVILEDVQLGVTWVKITRLPNTRCE